MTTQKFLKIKKYSKIMYKDFNKREITFLHKNHNLFEIKTNKLESYWSYLSITCM